MSRFKDVNPTSSLFWNNLDNNFIPPQKFISPNRALEMSVNVGSIGALSLVSGRLPHGV